MTTKILTAEEKAKVKAEAKLKKLEEADTDVIHENKEKAKVETEVKRSPEKAQDVKEEERKKNTTYDHDVKINGEWYKAGVFTPAIK